MSKMNPKKWQCTFSQPKEWVKGNVIGSGSYGTVHLSIDVATGALFVAKSATSEAGIKSLKNEADILENLNSPHVVKCIGKDVVFEKDGEMRYKSLFFEYMAGGSLSDVAHKFGGSLDEKLVRLYTREILRGLKYLHENGIVHSDVKCKNVLLGASGVVKLADFGCAKRVRVSEKVKENDKYGIIGGTPMWMAPEVLRNEQLGFAADIWSLGCTVIEMATGRPPWGNDASDHVDVMLRIARGSDVPEFPGHFSAEGLDFLSKCLERDPKKRWTSERLLDHPFVSGEKRARVCMSMRKDGDAVSPTSVLDVASYDSEDDDDSDLCDDDEFAAGIFRSSEKLSWKNEWEEVWEGWSDWMTVRSR